MFSKILLKAILSQMRDSSNGTVIMQDANFAGAKFEEAASFESVTFEGSTDFANASFSDKASFYGAKFGRYASFHNATFNGYADFEKAEFGQVAFKRILFRSVEFGKVVFHGIVEFVDVDFPSWVTFSHMVAEERAVFLGCTFHSGAIFQRAEFRRDLAFNSTFEYDADFSRAIFGGRSSFGGSKYQGNVHFSEAIFNGNASFSETEFQADAYFNSTKFCGKTDFDRAKFSGDATSFADSGFTNDVSFVEASVAGRLWISSKTKGSTLNISWLNAKGITEITGYFDSIDCVASKFNERTSFRLSGSELRLEDSSFAGPLIIESSSLPSSTEERDVSPVSFEFLRLRSLGGTNAEHLTLVDVDLSRCELAGFRRPEVLRFVGKCKFTPMPSGFCLRWGWLPWRWTAREALLEEHIWRSSVGSPAPKAGWATLQSNEQIAVVNPERLAVTYRQLRAVLESSKNEPGAADLYYGEMEMRRAAARASGRRAEKWILWAYWLVSGYGLRAGRALLMLAAVILGCATFLLYLGFSGITTNYVQTTLFASGAILSLDLGNPHLTTALTDWGDVARIVLRLAGPLLLGLAALAVRGRIKR